MTLFFVYAITTSYYYISSSSHLCVIPSYRHCEFYLKYLSGHDSTRLFFSCNSMHATISVMLSPWFILFLFSRRLRRQIMFPFFHLLSPPPFYLFLVLYLTNSVRDCFDYLECLFFFSFLDYIYYIYDINKCSLT